MKNISQKIKEINDIISAKPWFDFELIELKNKIAKIRGSTDFSYFYEIEIFMEDVCYIQCPDNWKSDTTSEVIIIPTLNEQKKINLSYEIEIGYILIQFIAEDIGPIYISCKNLNYDNEKVLYATNQ